MNSRYTKIANIVSVICVGLSLCLSFFFYSKFPEQVPTHWDFQGHIDGFSSRGFAAFFFPLFIVGMFVLFSILPKIDPHKERYAEFEKPYSLLKLAIIAFMTILYILIGLFGIGYELPIGTITPVMVGILLVFIGNYLGKVKNNWFVGVRTPWTLSNEEVWNRTHRLSGKLFVIAGVLIALTAFMDTTLRFPVFIAAIVCAVVVPIVYSYILSTKLTRKE